jgi:Fur family peroxide stress response transcriptional regulator
MEHEGHITVEALYEKIREFFPSLSLATVYKNMITLQEHHVVRELKISGQKNRYELKKAPHHHLVCHICGHITDIQTDIERPIKDLSLQYDFEIFEISLFVSGVCRACK